MYKENNYKFDQKNLTNKLYLLNKENQNLKLKISNLKYKRIFSRVQKDGDFGFKDGDSCDYFDNIIMKNNNWKLENQNLKNYINIIKANSNENELKMNIEIKNILNKYNKLNDNNKLIIKEKEDLKLKFENLNHDHNNLKTDFDSQLNINYNNKQKIDDLKWTILTQEKLIKYNEEKWSQMGQITLVKKKSNKLSTENSKKKVNRK